MYLLSSAGSVNRAVPDVMRQPTAYGVRLSGALRPTGSFDACPVFGGGSALKQMHRQHAGARTTRNARLCRARSAQIPEKIPDFLWKSRCSGAHADRPAVTRKKKRLQVVARIRMTCASGSRLISPRAAAHIWGKGARILTEINRLPHSGAKFPPNFVPLAAIPVYWTRNGADLMQMGGVETQGSLAIGPIVRETWPWSGRERAPSMADSLPFAVLR